MTQEQAINEVKKAIPTFRKETKEAIETLVPELKENEDEKIIKILIHIVKGACSEYGIKYRGYEITEEKLLTYLEKQKDHFRESTKKVEEPHYTKRNALFDKCVENCDSEIMKRVSDEIDAQLEKEQKSAEWRD